MKKGSLGFPLSAQLICVFVFFAYAKILVSYDAAHLLPWHFIPLLWFGGYATTSVCVL